MKPALTVLENLRRRRVIFDIEFDRPAPTAIDLRHAVRMASLEVDNCYRITNVKVEQVK